MKHRAHRLGEGTYSYRGFKIIYNYESKLWLEFDSHGDCDGSAKTLREAKQDIDNYIDFCKHNGNIW